LLTVEKLVREIVDRAMVKRPMELTLPRARSLLAKFGGCFPSMASLLLGSMTRTGLANQAKMK